MVQDTLLTGLKNNIWLFLPFYLLSKVFIFPIYVAKSTLLSMSINESPGS